MVLLRRWQTAIVTVNGKGDHAQINEQLQVVSVATQPLSTSEYIRADHYQGFAINFDFGDNTL